MQFSFDFLSPKLYRRLRNADRLNAHVPSEDSKSVPLWSPVPLWYHHKLTTLIYVKTFDYFIQKSNSALKNIPPHNHHRASPLCHALPSPLPPSTFHLMLIVGSLPLRHQYAGANAMTTPSPRQHRPANAPTPTPTCKSLADAQPPTPQRSPNADAPPPTLQHCRRFPRPRTTPNTPPTPTSASQATRAKQAAT